MPPTELNAQITQTIFAGASLAFDFAEILREVRGLRLLEVRYEDIRVLRDKTSELLEDTLTLFCKHDKEIPEDQQKAWKAVREDWKHLARMATVLAGQVAEDQNKKYGLWKVMTFQKTKDYSSLKSKVEELLGHVDSNNSKTKRISAQTKTYTNKLAEIGMAQVNSSSASIFTNHSEVHNPADDVVSIYSNTDITDDQPETNAEMSGEMLNVAAAMTAAGILAEMQSSDDDGSAPEDDAPPEPATSVSVHSEVATSAKNDTCASIPSRSQVPPEQASKREVSSTEDHFATGSDDVPMVPLNNSRT